MATISKKNPGALQVEQIVHAGFIKFDSASSTSEKVNFLSQIIIDLFDDYYSQFLKTPELAKQAFETRDWPRAIELSQERLGFYSSSVQIAAPLLKNMIGDGDIGIDFWKKVEQQFHTSVAEFYEMDLALAYLASLSRNIFKNIWTPVTHNRGTIKPSHSKLLRHIPVPGEMTPSIVEKIMAVPGINAPYTDMGGDAIRAANRMNSELNISTENPLQRIEIIDGGFYRNRGAYIVGAVEVAGIVSPMALALLHHRDGVEIDAVILRETTLRHIFSSTLANLHVNIPEYHELVDYLFELMPIRPHGLHYSTIGYNHLGKLAVMEQITYELKENSETLGHAPGPAGSVAMGFTSPTTQFVLKVIRDKPTEHYKWGEFHGRDLVLAKYKNVHELNRSGSMLDNIVLSNLKLPKGMFNPGLLEELLQQAGETISIINDEVLFSDLIVQQKLVPVPLYLESCTQEEAESVVIRLGQCIRNNAATNTFNKDLDGRNYGVSSLRFVYLFDYDAVEVLTDVKVRTNADMIDGDEDVPDWFFEEGIIFLPEELESHLRLTDRNLRRLFREAHGELLTLEYWTRMQGLLREGRVPRVRTYPRASQLKMDDTRDNLFLSPLK